MEQDYLTRVILTDLSLRNNDEKEKQERMQQAMFEAIEMTKLEKEVWEQSGMDQLIGKSQVGIVDMSQLDRLSEYLEQFAAKNPGMRLDVVMHVHQLCSRLILENDQLRTKLKGVCGLWVKETLKAQRLYSNTSQELGRGAA